jgi:glycosyltransferase involved in cell wall biosynthesis
MRLLSKLFKLITEVISKDTVFSIVNTIFIFLLPKATKDIKPGLITMVGMLRTASGLGQAARLTMNALIEQNYKLTSFDISKLFVDQFLEIKLPSNAKSDQEGGIIIIQNNPIHIPLILFLLGRKNLRNKKIIAYSVWETESIPESWVSPCKLVNEIWAPSDFAAQAFKNKIKNIPIKVVPHPLRQPIKVNFNRKYFSVPNDKMVILSIADLGSGFDRKNIIGTIETFKKVSAKIEEVFLVLKLSGTKRFPIQKAKLDALIKDLPNVLVIDSFLSNEEIQGLIAVSDIITSLHRSEGFGLIMAGAMWHSKPILATPWSANLTFLPKNCACYVKYKLVNINDSQNIYKGNEVWADPDIEDAAEKLIKLIKDKDLRKKLGTNAKKHAMKFFTKEAFAKQTNASLKYAQKLTH